MGGFTGTHTHGRRLGVIQDTEAAYGDGIASSSVSKKRTGSWNGVWEVFVDNDTTSLVWLFISMLTDLVLAFMLRMITQEKFERTL